MSLINERVRKAIERGGSLDLPRLSEKAEHQCPADLASAADLAERRRFIQQTSESSAEAQVSYERIIRGNELQDVNYLIRGTRAARAVGRIAIRERNGRLAGYGTGFLISDRIVLTNNHVLQSADWAVRSEVEFEYERDEAGTPMPGVKFSLDPGTLFFTHEQLDFSVVAVSPRAVNAERDLREFGYLSLIGGTGKAVEGEWLTIIQHPGGELKQLCVRENQLLEKSADVLWYSTDTVSGSSGSPVFNNDWLVVALHHSGVPEMKNGRWQTIDGQDYDERRHREEDIKWVANEGIRVSRIVQTLQREVGTHPLIVSALDVRISDLATPHQPAPETQPMNPSYPNPAGSSKRPAYLLTFDEAQNPILTRVQNPSTVESAMLGAERTQRRGSARSQPRGLSFRFDDDYSKRGGFDVNFLGKSGDKGKHRVNLPQLTPGLEASAVRLLEPDDTKDYVLKYTGMSVVMHKKRKFAIYSAANVDFARRYASLKSKRVWRYDPRIPLELQIGDEAYEGNQFDRGHLTRQEDMEYGDTMLDALQSTADTCHWTNCILQHDKFNRTKEWWQGMEQHILERSVHPSAKGFRAQIFTGPVFTKMDPEYAEIPGIKVPMKFWKVAAAVTSSGKLFAAAYLLDQSPVVKKYGVDEAAGETPFEPYKLFQLPIAELEAIISMKFTYGPQAKPLSDCDPLRDGTPPELDSDQDGYDDRYESTPSGIKTPEGWIDVERHGPYFGD